MFFLSLLASAMLPVQTWTDSLQTTVVVADRGQVVSRCDTVKVDRTQPLSNLFQQTPSFLISDFGGPAGQKNISLRGLGNAHTAIYLDGLRISNVQSGQMDMALLGMDIVDAIVIDYAQNSVAFNTSKPVFREGEHFNGRAGVRGGSFGTFRGYARVNGRISDRLTFTIYADGLGSKGNYPYLNEGTELRRDNNDFARCRAEGDLYGTVGGVGTWKAKMYYIAADRGTPGSIYYPSTDRQHDQAVAGQGSVKIGAGRYSLLCSARVAYDRMDYMASTYGQTDIQFNTVSRYTIADWVAATLTADYQYDDLKSKECGASRNQVKAGAGFDIRAGGFKADVAFLYEGAFDKGASRHNSFSPSADLRYRFFEGFDAVAFVRRAYRIPVFNELYYVGYGNPDLKPEDAVLSDIGLDFHRKVASSWTLTAKADGYYYNLRDKITSAPTEQDPNIWMPFNIGKVHSVGVDVSAGAEFSSGDWKASVLSKYSYQSAKDVTPDSYSYGMQIPYIPVHSVNASLDLRFRTWALSSMFNMKKDFSDSSVPMPDWSTFDFVISKRFSSPHVKSYLLSANLLNAFDRRYSLVSGYPMPGRSFTISLDIDF